MRVFSFSGVGKFFSYNICVTCVRPVCDGFSRVGGWVGAVHPHPEGWGRHVLVFWPSETTGRKKLYGGSQGGLSESVVLVRADPFHVFLVLVGLSGHGSLWCIAQNSDLPSE